MKTISFPDGTQVPALGHGTWMMGENPALRAQEIAALHEGIDLGMNADRHSRDVWRRQGQILYNLARRASEFDLLPWLADRRLPVMAYSPVEQGRLLHNPGLKEIAMRHDASPARVALAWLLTPPGILPIPKAGSVEHAQDNRAAADLVLTSQDLAELERYFHRPSHPRPLEML